MKKSVIILIMLFSLLMGNISKAQNLGIGPDTFDPDASAGVEMRFTNKGLLIPRLTLSQRNAISSPATSLIIYQTDNTPGYYYNAGTSSSPNWVRLATTGLDGSGAATRVAFWSGPNTLSSNTNLYWDNTNSRLGVGTSSPGSKLEIRGTADLTLRNDQTLSNSGDDLAAINLGDAYSGSQARILVERGAAGSGGDNPTDISFWNTPDGSVTLTERMRIRNDGNVGIGTTSPSYKLHVVGSDHAIYGVSTSTSDKYGVYGSCENQAYYGYGGYFKGGWKGVHGYATMSGTGSRYGVYGSASGGVSDNYGVYYSGGLGGSGTKSAIVRTNDGPKAVYCQESPENWFEDFGKAKIYDGKAIVSIAKDFLSTVTINEEYPMNVFITPNADLGGNWWVEESIDHFILHAPNAIDDAGFTYRIVAKRKGYENIRLSDAPGAWIDHYLYPNIEDVPDEYKSKWIESESIENWKDEWKPYMSTDQLNKFESYIKSKK